MTDDDIISIFRNHGVGASTPSGTLIRIGRDIEGRGISTGAKMVTESYKNSGVKPLRAPTGQDLYLMVTSRFRNGHLPWSMVSSSGKEAWERAASDLLLSPDTILAKYGEQRQRLLESIAKDHNRIKDDGA